MVSGFRGLRACCFRFSHTAAIPLPIHSSVLSFRRRLFVTNCSASVAGKKEKVIVISGPTGAGKSRLALELAKRLNGEIISADSVQVYRGLDVESAKPSLSERKGSTIADLSVSITRVENYQLPPEAPPLTPVRN